MKLKIYDCLVNRGGDVALCEIAKNGISEHELRVLREVHGGEAITKVAHVGEREFNQDDELNRLAAIYGQRRIEKLFGIQIENFEEWVNSRMEGKGSARDSVAAFVRPQSSGEEEPTGDEEPTGGDTATATGKFNGTLTLDTFKKPAAMSQVE